MLRLRISYYSRGSVKKCKLKIINRSIWEWELPVPAPKYKAPAIGNNFKEWNVSPLTPYNIMPQETHERKLDKIQAVNVIP